MTIEIAKLLAEVSALARTQADAHYMATPEATELRRVARALCTKAGHDPDIVVMGWENQPLAVGAKRVAAVQMPINPQWVLFTREAQAAIEVMNEEA
jgi:hypothetical protein